MVEFQFYRPQANALEQLWSQYAQARGQEGGAFERGFVPGMMAGFEGLAKKQAAKAETEARAAERKEDRDFQKTLIDEKTAADQRERDKLAANDLAVTTQLFSANGENPHDAYMRAQVVKTPENARAVIATERGAKEQKDKEAAAAAEAARLKSERDEAGGLFTALQGDKLTDSIAIQGAMDLVNSADEKLILEGKDKLRTLAQESRQRGALMTDIDELLGVGDLTTAARQGKTLVQPGKEDEFTEARNVLIGAKRVMSDPRSWQGKSPADRQAIVKSAEEASIKIRTLTSPNPYQDPRLRDEYSKQGLRNWLQLGDAKAPVVFYNGQVAGVTPEDKSSLDLWINKQISNDPILRNVLRDQGVDQNLVQTALAAGNTAGITQLLGNTTPGGADVRTLIEEARTRITKDTLRSMGVRIVDPQIPEGVNVIQALQPTQQAEVARIVQAFEAQTQQTTGRNATDQEVAQHLLSKGYLDLEDVAQGTLSEQAAQTAKPIAGAGATATTAATPAAGAAQPEPENLNRTEKVQTNRDTLLKQVIPDSKNWLNKVATGTSTADDLNGLAHSAKRLGYSPEGMKAMQQYFKDPQNRVSIVKPQQFSSLNLQQQNYIDVASKAAAAIAGTYIGNPESRAKVQQAVESVARKAASAYFDFDELVELTNKEIKSTARSLVNTRMPNGQKLTTIIADQIQSKFDDVAEFFATVINEGPIDALKMAGKGAKKTASGVLERSTRIPRQAIGPVAEKVGTGLITAGDRLLDVPKRVGELASNYKPKWKGGTLPNIEAYGNRVMPGTPRAAVPVPPSAPAMPLPKPAPMINGRPVVPGQYDVEAIKKMMREGYFSIR
jgi:hypothetical protein